MTVRYLIAPIAALIVLAASAPASANTAYEACRPHLSDVTVFQQCLNNYVRGGAEAGGRRGEKTEAARPEPLPSPPPPPSPRPQATQRQERQPQQGGNCDPVDLATADREWKAAVEQQRIFSEALVDLKDAHDRLTDGAWRYSTANELFVYIITPLDMAGSLFQNLLSATGAGPASIAAAGLSSTRAAITAYRDESIDAVLEEARKQACITMQRGCALLYAVTELKTQVEFLASAPESFRETRGELERASERLIRQTEQLKQKVETSRRKVELLEQVNRALEKGCQDKGPAEPTQEIRLR